MAPRGAIRGTSCKTVDTAEGAATGKSQRAALKSSPKPTRKRKVTAVTEACSSDGASPSTTDASAGPDTNSDSDSAAATDPAPKRNRRGGASSSARAASEGKSSGRGRKVPSDKVTAASDAGPQGGAKRAKGGHEIGAKAEGSANPVPERDPPGRRYFLMKSEPDEFSLDALASKENQTSHWEGVRNAQARNIMRSMRLGDEAFFYHSSCKVPAVVGVVRVVREAYPDHFAFDKTSKYYDPRSTPEAPKWWMVDVQLVRRLPRPVTLAELREEGARGPPVRDMVLINKSRLSVQPVTQEQWERILEMEAQGKEGGNKEKEAVAEKEA